MERSARGCGTWSCAASSVAVAVLAWCFIVVWYAVERYADMRGCVAVDWERCVNVGHSMELWN
eukprot:3577806-Alexandrium_andersonii.AAC.1